MKVFKFGGASISNIERINKVRDILKEHRNEPLIIVISAMGKTTNALEKVAASFFNNAQEEAQLLFEKIKKDHITLSKYLLVTHYLPCEKKLQELFAQAEQILQEKPVQPYDYYYDQLVSLGELLSTIIVSSYLNEMGVPNQWLDVRNIIRTDDNYRDANIDWVTTEQNIKKIVLPILEEVGMVLTQGFIGATATNESTTLGREGSDYSAAVFAGILNAESQTIWKDVPSVMNADPREVPDALPLPELNYLEVIEMAYYGAQVIHPKTIKPLQNKSIPLYVKCFLDPSLPGTLIHNNPIKDLPPVIVIKRNQVMVELQSKDFSFIGEGGTTTLYQLFEELSMRPNLTQNEAIDITCVFDNREEKIAQLASAAARWFDVQITKGLQLLTIRHYDAATLEKYVNGKDYILRQQTPEIITLLHWEKP